MSLTKSVWALACLAAAATAVNATPGVVHTDGGDLQGYTSDSVDVWRGIPFAEPPTGNNRFKQSVPPSPWSGVRAAIEQSHICPQVRLTDFLYLGDENCLYLDVYAPANRADPLPVLVWFFGGGYVFGDGWEFGFYDGINLAKLKDMIIVTPNYRLGSLGFMALPELASENADGISGSMAVLDQRLALQWVQKNIRAFGGDPARVTIAGESAGAFSVCFHLASPGSAGLFSAAISESGTCEAREFFVPLEQSVSWSQTYSAMVGCDPAKLTSAELLPCLRKLSTGEVMGHLLGQPIPSTATLAQQPHAHHARTKQQWIASMHALAAPYRAAGQTIPLLYPIMPWGPTIDGNNKNLPDSPLSLIQHNKWNAVPVIFGTNNNEGDIFIPLLEFVIPKMHFPLQQQDLAVAFGHFFNGNTSLVDTVLAEYPLYNFKDAEDCASVILRDYFFFCPARNALTAIDATGQHGWLYHFTYPGDFIEDPILGDYHSAELPFVFHNPWPPILHSFSPNDEKMSNTFNTYWSNLVHFHDPNGNGTSSAPAVAWPRFNATSYMNVVLDVPASVETNLIRDKCDFWTTINAQYPW